MENVKKKFQNPVAVVFFTIFLDLIGVGLLIPIIPQIVANPASNFYLLPNGFSISDGYILLGFLTAIYPIMQFIATPILGQLSDRYGRKPLLTISLFGTAISYVLFAIGIITRNIPLLFISRAFDGITGGNIAVAQAALADITTPENRTKTFGLIGAAFGLGFVLGPYIGGKLSDPTILSWFDATTPFWFAAILSLLNVISVLFIFPETNKHMDKLKQIDWGKSLSNITRAFFSLKGVRTIFATNFLFFSGFTFFTTFASVFFISKFHWNQGNVGDYFAYVGIWMAIAQAVVTRQIAKYLNESQILKFSLFGTAIGIAMIFLASEAWMLFFITPIFAIFVGLTFANTTGLVSRSVEARIQGEILGINASVQALAQSIPPILSGYIAASLAPESPLIVGSIVIALGGLFFFLMFKPPKGIQSIDDTSVMAH